MTIDDLVKDFPRRRPPRDGQDVVPSYIEHDLAIGPERLAELEYRLRVLPLVEARAHRPDDHRAWIGFDGDRWIKIDCKLTTGSSRWPRLRGALALVGRPRGPVVAVTGPDGAGKSTLIETLNRSLPAQVRVHYLGRGASRSMRPNAIAESDGLAVADCVMVDHASCDAASPQRKPSVARLRPSLFRECVFVLRWAARDWIRMGLVHLDAHRGAVVLCDRHPVEARARRRREHDLTHWLEQRITPGRSGVDLFVLLSGDPAAFHQRKQEHDPETLGEMIVALRSVLPVSAAELDATNSPEVVARQAAQLVFEAWRRRDARNIRNLTALDEAPERPCLVVDPTGSEGIEKLLVWVRRHQLARLASRVSADLGTGFQTLELSVRSPGVTRIRSRLSPRPTAFRLRTGKPTALDLIIDETGIHDVGPPRLGAGGGLALWGYSGDRAVLLRVGQVGSTADPTHHGAGLAWAKIADVAAPELLDSGEVAGHCWSLEELVDVTDLSSVRSMGSCAPAVQAWVRTMIEVRRRPHPSPLPERQRLELIGHFPRFQSRLDAVNERFEAPLSELGSAPAHGDLWAGNLLPVDGSVVAVDWDAWSDEAVPGLDLVHCHVESRRRSGDLAGLSLGRLLQRRPWDDDDLLATVQTVVGGKAGRLTMEAIVYSVWLNSASNTLRRTPRLRWSESWAAHNIVGGLAAFEIT